MTLRWGLFAQCALALSLWAGVVYSLWRWPSAVVEQADPGRLLSCPSPADLSATLVTPGGRYVLSPRGAGPSGRRLMTIHRAGHGETRKGAAAPPRGAHTELMAMISQLPPQEQFSTQAAADAWAQRLADLPISRNLGAVPQARLGAFGFAPSERWTLTTACAGRHDTFELGASVDGTGQRYIRRQGGEDLWMVRGEPFSQLRSARFGFMLKALLSVPLREVTGLTWSVGERSVTVVRQGDGGFYVQGNQRELAGLGSWLKGVITLPVKSFLPPDWTPEMRASASFPLHITFLAGDRSLGSLRLLGGAATPSECYGRSTDTGAWVQLYVEAATAAWTGLDKWPELPHPDRGAMESRGSP